MAVRDGYHNIKIRDEGFARLGRLVATLSQHGWTAAGVTRATERVSNLSVLDVALELLEKQLRVKKR